MNLGEKKYSNMDEGKGRKTKLIAIIGILAGAIGVFSVLITFFLWGGIYPLSAVPFVFGITALFFGQISISKEFGIYERGIKVPKYLWRKSYPYKEIKYLDLNTRKTTKKMYVTIELNDGKKINYPKMGLMNWNRFVDVVKNFLSVKTEVKGLE